METIPFNDEYRRRTKLNALKVISFYQHLSTREELRILGKQLIRSATSMAANFRAACRGRSRSEHYAKLCIVVEECDETLFWLEMIEETRLISNTIIDPLKEETLAILKVLSMARKTQKPIK